MSLDRKELPEHHLKYEIEMLLAGAKVLTDGKLNGNIMERWFQSNAYLESFLVHLRNLVDFLWVEPTKKGDISAKCFTSCNKYSTPNINNNSIKVGGDSIKNIKMKINKEISHLTDFRTNYPTIPEVKEWKIKEITRGMIEHLLKYLDNCDQIDKEYQECMENELKKFEPLFCSSSCDVFAPHGEFLPKLNSYERNLTTTASSDSYSVNFKKTD